MSDLIRKSDALALPYRLSPSLDAADGYYVSVDAIRALPAVTVGVETCSRCCGCGMTIGDGGDPRICPKCKGDGVEPVAAPGHDVVEIDLRAAMMEQIEEAASQSPWVPPEYMMNEIISDCCTFLREARAPDPAAIREAAAVVEREIEQAKQLMPMVVPILRGVHRSILALIPKGAAEPTEYERKVAQIKKDFPNGI